MAIYRGSGGSVESITESDVVTIAISQGGTGAQTAADARTNLGLGTAATTDASAYATADQGILADSAVQPGDIGTAAAQNVGYFATAAQGALADSAVQPADLGAVATSNSYDDLDDLPTLGTASAEDVGYFATAAQGALADTATQPGDLATVATTGAYSDLSGTPTVPTNLDSLTDVVITSVSTDQLLKYNGTNWVNATVGGTGTVTSVDMSVPTGLSVSGNPVTTAGTLAVTYASGYAIPTTAKQTEWDTAYGWGNHASAGYAADSAVVHDTGDETIAGLKTFSTGIVLGRVNSGSEGGQLDLCRSSDNASAWAVDVYGDTSTPSLRFVDNTASATRMAIDGSGKVLIGNTADTAFGDSNAALQITGASFNTSSSVQARFSSSDSGGSAYRIFARSKSATLGTNAAVDDDDELGVIQWRGADGTSYVSAASITANIDGTPGTDDMPGRLVFSTTADGASSPTERMRISSDNVTTFGLGSAEQGLDRATVKIRSAATSSSNVATTPRTALEIGWQEGSQDLGANEGTAIAFSASLNSDSGVYQEVARIGSNKDSSSDSERASSIIFETSTDGTTANLTEAVRITSGQGLKISRTAVTSPATGDGNVFSGTYTPTLTNTTNIAASTASALQYMRVGDVVTVSGSVLIDPTATGLITLGLSLPVASNFSAVNQCGGMFGTVGGEVGVIYANTTNDRATFQATIVSDISNTTYRFSFTYQVI